MGGFGANILSIFLLSLSLHLVLGKEARVENFVRSEVLSDYYRVQWDVDFTKRVVTFEVEAQTTGYVGFGFSPNGGMAGSDVVIGGVHTNGSTYFDDRYATGNGLPQIDPVQNWFLISASEDGTANKTTLKFYRNFSTCDENDLTLTEDTTHLIYSIGATDSLERHAQRGTKALNLLDPPNPPVNLDDLSKWNMTTDTPLPDQDTAYWCTVHKTPKFRQKAHIVGFSVMLESPEALKYTHHLVLHRCVQPAGMDVNLTEILEPWVGHPGGECYNTDENDVGQLFQYCKTYFYVWAKGGDALLLPEHVGFPIGEDSTRDEYFILEIHYDNPELDEGVKYTTGVTIYHTYDLRENDAGLLFVGHDSQPSMIIPPDTKDFVNVGHCDSSCTDSSLPDSGINVFNILLHSHLDGRKLKLRHFRDGEELPWMGFDGNFDFNYQQNRPLRNEVKILRKDHISYECTCDSSWKEPKTVTIGGLSTRHEMCEAFLLYYPLVRTVDICGSLYPFEKLIAKFGILNTTLPFEDPTVTAPEEFAGLSFTQVLNTRVNWTQDLVNEIRQLMRYDDHLMFCVGYNQTRKLRTGNSLLTYYPQEEDDFPRTNYPEIREPYEPPQEVCSESNLA